MNESTETIHGGRGGAPNGARKRAVVYLRQTSAQTHDDHWAVAQREACAQHAERIGAEIIEEYVDGIDSRDARRRLVYELPTRKPDYVIVYSVDRLSRERAEGVRFVHRIGRAGAVLESVTDDDAAAGRPARSRRLQPSPGGAAIYVRVSSTGQLGRDGDEDGYSIPAQVQACERKAADLAAPVAKVYIERAESARSAARPVLQQMLEEIKSLGVSYVIVHKVDRFARNRLDDAVLYEQLVRMDVTLVSATENIDATPTGRLMHGMLATYAEYYSNNLATEIRKGMDQKHRLGGTPFKPPIGYMAHRELTAGQDVRSVALDPLRAPLVQRAFELYCTGDWPLRRLTAYLAEAGLTSRPTRTRPAAPLRMTSVQKVLTNPYYYGIVVYKGRRVQGRHEPLISVETFEQVQAIMTAKRKASDRPSVHHHYLKGTVFCADCGGRLLYGRHTGNGGLYEYFSCINRRSRSGGGFCDSRHYLVDEIDRKLVEHYRTVRLNEEVRERVRNDIREDAQQRTALVKEDLERTEQALTKLEAEQEHLLDLLFKRLVSENVLARKQRQIEEEQARLQRERGRAQEHLGALEEEVEEVLGRTITPYEVYKDATASERRLLNQTFFKRVLVGEDCDILGTSLTPEYAALAQWTHGYGQPARGASRSPEKAADAASGRKEQTPVLLENQGLPFDFMVETVGIEPTSAVPLRMASTSVASALTLAPPSLHWQGPEGPAP